MATKQTLNIVRGKTVQLAIRWETTPVVSVPITAISLAYGAPRITATGHGLTNGWRVAVTRVLGMKQINAENTPPRDSDYSEATVLNADTIELNGVVPVDENGREWSAYTSGDFIQYNTPKSLSGKTIRVKIKDKANGTVLLSTEAGDSPLNLITADASDATRTILIEIPASATEDLTWDKGVWKVEAADVSGVVDSIIAVSPVYVSDEVVTP